MVVRDTDVSNGDAIVIGSPVAVGHVRPLMAVASRFVQRGFTVVWAISGDANEPAAKWREPLTRLGVVFIDVDEVKMFARGSSTELATPNIFLGLLRRIIARANDVASAAAEEIRKATAGRRIRCGVYDFFATWAYVAMKQLGVAQVDAVLSGFPGTVEMMPQSVFTDDPVCMNELAQLRAAGHGAFTEVPRGGIIPRDPQMRVLCFTSSRLCPAPPPFVRLLGVQHDALPRTEDLGHAPAEHQALASRLRTAREGGARVVLLSMGTEVMKWFARIGPERVAYLRRLYSTLAASALRAGAIVVASTTALSAAELGIDEATLGPDARDRLVAMSFVPQPLLFAHGLIDVMLMHGGANTFHEAVASAIPVLISPGFGDQESVALAAASLGVGVCIETVAYPNLAGAVPIERVADEILPAMLAPGTSVWKAAAMRLAEHVAHEDGLDALESVVLG